LKLKVTNYKMKWFAVNYVYQIICGEGNHTPQFNEQIRLITAPSLTKAIQKANKNAALHNQPFINCQGESVIWKFLSLRSVMEIQTPVDGVEAASVIIEPACAETFIKNLEFNNSFYNRVNQKN